MDFYPADWLLGTMAMSAEARGAYIDLLCHAWDQSGTMPNDDTVLARLARVDGETWERVRFEVLAKFVETSNGRLRHRRVDAEIRRAKQRSKVASANARKRKYESANGDKSLADNSEVASNRQCQNDARARVFQQLPATSQHKAPNGAYADSPCEPEGQPARKSRKRPPRPIPADWKPDIEAAISMGLARDDAEAQARRLRNWAEANDKRYVDWDAVWRNWCESRLQKIGADAAQGRQAQGPPRRSFLEKNEDLLRAQEPLPKADT